MTSPSTCTPCNCIPANMGRDYFRVAGLTVLCEILGISPVSFPPPKTCAPCGCIPPNMGKEFSKAAVLSVLCQILQAYESVIPPEEA